MSSPQRIQRQGIPGWRKPEGAVDVTVRGKWGNPISFLDVGEQYPSLNDTQVATLILRDFRALAMRGRVAFPNWRFFDGHRGPVEFTYPSVDEIRAELAGHALACWCALDEPCHADVLLELANQAAP